MKNIKINFNRGLFLVKIKKTHLKASPTRIHHAKYNIKIKHTCIKTRSYTPVYAFCWFFVWWFVYTKITPIFAAANMVIVHSYEFGAQMPSLLQCESIRRKWTVSAVFMLCARVCRCAYELCFWCVCLCACICIYMHSRNQYNWKSTTSE